MNCTAIIKQDGSDWIGWIEEIPGVNCQGKSEKDLMHALKITLQEAIEFNREDAILEAKMNYKETLICV